MSQRELHGPDRFAHDLVVIGPDLLTFAIPTTALVGVAPNQMTPLIISPPPAGGHEGRLTGGGPLLGAGARAGTSALRGAGTAPVPLFMITSPGAICPTPAKAWAYSATRRGLRENEKRWRIGLPGACEPW